VVGYFLWVSSLLRLVLFFFIICIVLFSQVFEQVLFKSIFWFIKHNTKVSSSLSWLQVTQVTWYTSTAANMDLHVHPPRSHSCDKKQLFSHIKKIAKNVEHDFQYLKSLPGYTLSTRGDFCDCHPEHKKTFTYTPSQCLDGQPGAPNKYPVNSNFTLNPMILPYRPNFSRSLHCYTETRKAREEEKVNGRQRRCRCGGNGGVRGAYFNDLHGHGVPPPDNPRLSHDPTRRVEATHLDFLHSMKPQQRTHPPPTGFGPNCPPGYYDHSQSLWAWIPPPNAHSLPTPPTHQK